MTELKIGQRGGKTARVLMLLRAGYTRMETANRAPASIRWVIKVANQHGLAMSPHIRNKQGPRLEKFLTVRVSRRQRNRIMQAAQLLVAEHGDPSEAIRVGLDQWALGVIKNAGLIVPKVSRKSRLAQVKELLGER